MWVRRALQRAEPGALQGLKGRTVGSVLGAGFGPSTTGISSFRAARPEGKARNINTYLFT